MRQLLPVPADVDPHEAHAAAHRPAPADRPWVMLNVVTSIDGATAVGGVSAPLGSPADKLAFSALRAAADVILVGAATVTAERYRAPRTAPTHQQARVARGQRAKPRIAVVSASLGIPDDLDLFDHPDERPFVVTTDDADPQRVAALGHRADIVRAGSGRVNLAVALGLLRPEGPLVLCEGGSTLNGALIAAGLVDEVNVSFSPLLAAGTSPRLANAPTEALTAMELAHLWEADDMLLARYVARTSAGR